MLLNLAANNTNQLLRDKNSMIDVIKFRIAICYSTTNSSLKVRCLKLKSMRHSLHKVLFTGGIC